MSNTVLQGKVSFVNYEKKYVMIEYEVNGKKKNINGNVDDKTQAALIEKKIVKKKHIFHIGDVVDFIAKLSDRGDKMMASNIQYKYNTALDVLLNKAITIENKFTGYLKVVDDKYFVKEIDSYLFFPVPFSAWQIKPTEAALNETVHFTLENIERKEKVTARLLNNNFIPAFYAAVKLHKSKTPTNSVVSKITPHAVYVNIVNETLPIKLTSNKEDTSTYKMGDIIPVLITYISDNKIIIEKI
jgi:hypothetical protein